MHLKWREVYTTHKQMIYEGLLDKRGQKNKKSPAKEGEGKAIIANLCYLCHRQSDFQKTRQTIHDMTRHACIAPDHVPDLAHMTRHAYVVRDLYWFAFCFSFVTPLVKRYPHAVYDICQIYHLATFMQSAAKVRYLQELQASCGEADSAPANIF